MKFCFYNINGALKFKLGSRSLIVVLCLNWLIASFALSIPKGKYIFNQQESKMNFTVKNFAIFTVEGKFLKFSGSIDVNDLIKNSRVETDAEISSIDTNIVSRDEHLRSSDFFDHEKYPTMSFKSTMLEGDFKSFKLSGDLTIKGVTKNVIFIVTGKENEKLKNNYIFLANTSINRNDFNITYGSTVSDTVNIQLEIHATQETN